MILYFDGGCRPNPGQMELAVISDCGTVKIHEKIGHGTNNVAEWLGLLAAVQTALDMPGNHIIRGDSKLVISQAIGVWKINKPELIDYKKLFDTMVGSQAKQRLIFQHVLRDYNLAGKFLEKEQKRK